MWTGNIKDLTGTRFGRLVALRLVAKNLTRWECRCDCGTVAVIRSSQLCSGGTKSCGCLKREIAIQSGRANRKHGNCAERTPTYISWVQMIARCTNPKLVEYPRYGGAGVTVCERWRGFTNFLADMGDRPKGKTLDRWPNPAGNYELENCRWATPLEQSRNRQRKPKRDSETGRYLPGRGIPA